MKRNRMKAARIIGTNDIRIADVPIPEIGAQDILCKVVKAGICGTDYSIYTGEFSFVKNGNIKFPMTPGHEWSGIVEKVGSAVATFKSGDRVVGDTYVSCDKCYYCLHGEPNHCGNMRCVGTINTWDGAYAEYIVMPERHLFHLPDNVSFDNGAMVEPAATALYAVTLANTKIGDNVLVQGSGPIGIMAAKLAKLSGAATVIITGRKDFKLDKALVLGVDAAINTTKESVSEAIKRHTGSYGIDRIIEASGSTELFNESIKIIKPGGVISVVAFYEKMVEGFDIDKFVLGDITIRAVAGSFGMYIPVLKLMAAGMIDFTSLVTERYPLEEVQKAMQDMKEKNKTRIKMMLTI